MTRISQAPDFMSSIAYYVAWQKYWLCCNNDDAIVNSASIQESRGVPFMSNASPFKWRHFEAEIILLCVRWYLRYALSYRDLEELMQERGLHVDHTTIYRWVQRYAPELEKRCRPHFCSLQRLVESGRDLYQNPKNLDVALPGRRLGRQHLGVSAESPP